MSMGLERTVARDDQDPALHMEHFDRRAVEPREHLAVDHLLDRAESGLSVAEVEHAVHDAEERIDVMGGEEHRDAEACLDALHQLDDRMLVARVEADEGLVEE